MSPVSRRAALALVLAAARDAASAAAQTAIAATGLATMSRSASAQTDSTSGKRPSLFTRRDAIALPIVAAGTAALVGVDKRIAIKFHFDPNGEKGTGLDVANAIKTVNERSLFVTSAALYAVGRLGRMERMAAFGAHASEAILTAAAINTVIKGAAGRSRPFESARSAGTFDTANYDPRDFHPGWGFSKPQYRSLPSLHEGGTYAFVTVLADHWGQWHPGSARVAKPVLWGLAVAPGLARMYTNKHWASDVFLGIATGIFSANKVERWNHVVRPHNRLDRILLGASISPGTEPGERWRASFTVR